MKGPCKFIFRPPLMLSVMYLVEDNDFVSFFNDQFSIFCITFKVVQNSALKIREGDIGNGEGVREGKR